MLTLTPGADQRPSWLPAELFPFQSRYVEIDGSRVHYIDEGSGPTLLFLHGNPTYSFLYRHLISGLKGRFRCVALDYPGFGLSIPKTGYGFTPGEHSRIVEAFARQLDLRDLTVMVQDWGGPVGLGFAGRAPERIRALIIGNTWAWPVNGDKHFERFSALTGGWFGGLMIRHFNAFVNLILRTSVERKKLSRAEMNAYRGPFPTPAAHEPTHIFPEQIIGARAYLAEVEQNLATLKAKPTLLVWGDKDPAFRLQERQRFEGIFATHRTVELPGSGHYIQEDAPDEIAQAIARWWDEVVAQLA